MTHKMANIISIGSIFTSMIILFAGVHAPFPLLFLEFMGGIPSWLMILGHFFLLVSLFQSSITYKKRAIGIGLLILLLGIISFPYDAYIMVIDFTFVTAIPFIGFFLFYIYKIFKH
jgi:hypothetical protein